MEAARLKALISDVYGCHGNVRKELAEAECSGQRLNAKRKRREILYRRCEAFYIYIKEEIMYICICLKLHKTSLGIYELHTYVHINVYNCLNLHLSIYTCGMFYVYI